MSIKLIALDLDGTIVEGGTTKIDQYTLDVIEKAKKAGIKVCIATGRTYASLLPVYNMLNLSTHIISNGGAIINDKDGNMLHKDYLDPKRANRFLAYVNEHGIYAQTYQSDKFQYYKDTTEFRAFAALYSTRTGLDYDLDLTALTNENISTPKIVAMAGPDDIQAVTDKLRAAFPDLSVRDSMAPYIEIFEHTASKGKALHVLAKIYGIKIEETMAIGDTGIDACMIKEAGIGVAMGDSAPDIKEIADYVTLDFDKHGAAYAIEKFCM